MIHATEAGTAVGATEDTRGVDTARRVKQVAVAGAMGVGPLAAVVAMVAVRDRPPLQEENTGHRICRQTGDPIQAASERISVSRPAPAFHHSLAAVWAIFSVSAVLDASSEPAVQGRVRSGRVDPVAGQTR